MCAVTAVRAATDCRVALTSGEIPLRVSGKLNSRNLPKELLRTLTLTTRVSRPIYMRGKPIQNYPCYFIFVTKTFNRYNFDYTVRFVNRFLCSNFSLARLLIYRLFIRTELFGRKEKI